MRETTQTSPDPKQESKQESKPSQSKEQDIANQWIDYLKRRNTSLTMLWVFFLILSIALASLSIYLFMQIDGISADNRVLSETVSGLEAERETQVRAYQALEAEQSALQAELDLKVARLDELETFQGETDSQLNLTSRLVDALKQKVASLEKEISLLEEALYASETKAKSLDSALAKAKKRSTEQLALLNSRKSAYDALAKRQVETQEEMQRLAEALGQVKEREDSLDQRNASLAKELKSTHAELKQVATEKIELQSRLEALTMPIRPSRSASEVSQNPLQSTPKPTPEGMLTLPEPVIAPENEENPRGAGAQQSKATIKDIVVDPAPLEFDSIAIE